MTKLDKLKKLDDIVLDKMIELVEDGRTELLPELSSVISYLSKNNITEDKQASSVEDEIKKRVKEANARRELKESK